MVYLTDGLALCMERLAEAAKGIFNSFIVSEESNKELLIMKKLKHGIYIKAILKTVKRTNLDNHYDLLIQVNIKDILHACSTEDYIASILNPETINDYIRKAEEAAKVEAQAYCLMNKAFLCLGLPEYLETYGFNQFILDIHERRFKGTIFIRVNAQLFMLYQSDDDTIQITHDEESEEFTHPNLYDKILHYLMKNKNPQPPPLSQQLLCTLDRIVTNLITHDGATR